MLVIIRKHSRKVAATANTGVRVDTRWDSQMGPTLTNQALCCGHQDVILAAQRQVTPPNNRYKDAMTSPLCHAETAATSIARRSNIPEAIYKGEALDSLQGLVDSYVSPSPRPFSPTSQPVLTHKRSRTRSRTL